MDHFSANAIVSSVSNLYDYWAKNSNQHLSVETKLVSLKEISIEITTDNGIMVHDSGYMVDALVQIAIETFAG